MTILRVELYYGCWGPHRCSTLTLDRSSLPALAPPLLHGPLISYSTTSYSHGPRPHGHGSGVAIGTTVFYSTLPEGVEGHLDPAAD